MSVIGSRSTSRWEINKEVGMGSSIHDLGELDLIMSLISSRENQKMKI